MTEEEWLLCKDPTPMLELLGTKASERKLRLFATACCRRIAHVVPVDDLRTIVDISESYADEINSSLRDACNRVESYLYHENREITVIESIALEAFYYLNVEMIALGVIQDSAAVMGHLEFARQNLSKEEEARTINAQGATVKMYLIKKGWKDENIVQSKLLRDILGNPLHQVSFSPAWLSHNVLALGDAIYTNRSFDLMPILADALIDAGCENEDILKHCREPGEHVRGCWVVDLILGKS